MSSNIPQVLYVTNDDWGMDREEVKIFPDRDDIVCISCGETKDVYKLVCDTPSSFWGPDGECRKCLDKHYTKVEEK